PGAVKQGEEMCRCTYMSPNRDRLRVVGDALRVARNETVTAESGESTAGMRIVEASTPTSITAKPAPTTAAPMSPPKSAWLEEEGRPSSQVTRFHTIAPMSPARISSGPI